MRVMATEAQIKYIECLAIDLGFDRRNRNWAIEAIIDRPVKFLDELTKLDASKVIADFKERKDRSDPREADFDLRDDYRK